MHTAELSIQFIQNKQESDVKDAIDILLGALRMNGQVLGREFPTGLQGNCYHISLLLPETNSLDKRFTNKYVERALDKFVELGISYTLTFTGEEPDSAQVCNCDSPSGYVLFTHYLSLESPLRCGDCFGVIPLYKFPSTKDEEYGDIKTWESDYQACDTLQMNCATGERFGINQMSKYTSSLSKRGIDICNRISSLTGKPAFYYLYRGLARGKNAELKRKCPSCGGDWLLDTPLHDLFDFCCDQCKLISNIAWSVRD